MMRRTSDRPGGVTGRTMAWALAGAVLGLAVLALAALAALSGSRTPGGPTPGTSVPGVQSSPSAPARPSASAGAAASLAPAFTLPTVGGGTLSTAAERGRLLVLNFTAPDCPTCAKQIPVLDAAAARFSPAGVTVAIVDISGLDDDRAIAEGYRSYGWTDRVPIAKDTKFAVAQAYGLTNMGETYVIDRDGRLRWQGVWEDEETLFDAIETVSGS